MDTEWKFDMQHSSVAFRVRHFLVSQVRGRFTRWSGWMRFDPHDSGAGALAVQIDAASVDTADAKRDADLRSSMFLDVAHFPTITFTSTRVERLEEMTFRVRGDLTIRGTTRPVALTVEYGGAMHDSWWVERTGFAARATIDRRDFGLTFNHLLDHGGVALGDEVVIEIDVEATRPIESLARSATF